MAFQRSIATVAALSTLISNSVALNVDSKTNVAVYYGQGAYQDRLSHFCQETSLDIINLGFINVFPEAVGDWPGSNFGNQCDGNVYEGTELLSGCHQIWEDIPVCKELGKTVMLSLGGESDTYQDIPSDEVAEWFADFLWYSFGPPGQNSSFPRPFQDNQVDGFDFDIEHNGGDGYAAMIKRLRSHYADFPDETFYISGAPQCQLPDDQLSNAIAHSDFDFIWVQWYNTPGCSAMDFVNGTGIFNFAQWAEVIESSANPNAKLFVGLPASEAAAQAGFYLTPEEVYPLVDIYMNLYPDMFGGIMLWEATAADNNVIDGHDYTEHMKHILHKCDPSPPVSSTSTIFVTPTPSPKPTSSTPSSAAHTSTTSASQTSSPISSPSSHLISSSTSASHIASPSSSLSTSASTSSSQTLISSSSSQSSSLAVSSSSSKSSYSTPIASPSTSSSTTRETPISSPAGTHLHSSSTSAAPDKSSTKSVVTSSQTPSSSGSTIATHSDVSTKPTTHSSSFVPGKPTHSTGTIQTSSSRPVVSPSKSLTSESSSTTECSESSTSESSTSKSSTSESLGSSTSVSSSSSASRVPSRTPITRTPVSTRPSATATSVSSSKESSISASSSATTTSVVTSSECTKTLSRTSDETETSSYASYSTSSSLSHTGDESATGAQSSTDAQSTATGAQPTDATNSSTTGAQSTETGKDSTTGAQPTGISNGSTTGVMITASPSVTSIPTTTEAPTVTTIIVTSYVDICPTGFTTITTTITTTFCSEATAGVTNPPSGPAMTTPSIPEGWTTTVKVCDNCAPTPTTVTLTVPNPAKPTESAVETSPVPVITETWTTTSTFCKHCGPTGAYITYAIPYTTTVTAVETLSASPSSGDSEATVPTGLPQTTLSNSQGQAPNPGPSSSWIYSSGRVHPTSQTPVFKIHPSTTLTVDNSSPTETSGDGVSPAFNGAGSQSGSMNLFGISIAALISIFALI